MIDAVLDRLEEVDLPGAYLVAGAVAQTVWNVVTKRPPGYGIRDYDIAYFDPDDLSAESERAASARFDDLGVPCDVVNQARVHLWYEDAFGVPCPPFGSTEDAIACFEATAVAVGVRRGRHGLDVHAPYGLADTYRLVARPTGRLAPPKVFAAKVARWRARWPELRVQP